jgi:hypothetical protein
MKLDVYTLTLRKAVVNDIVNRLLRENVLYNTYLYCEVRTPPITSCNDPHRLNERNALRNLCCIFLLPSRKLP